MYLTAMLKVVFSLFIFVAVIASVAFADVSISSVTLSPGVAAAHHTDKYKLKGSAVEGYAVIRRGQEFSIDVTFSGNVDSSVKVAIASPSFVKLKSQASPNSNVITITCTTDTTITVGKNDVVVTAGSSKGTMHAAFIFNPFLAADTSVYMGDVPTAEYLENDYGRVFLGSIDSYSKTAWYYGSQDGSTLATALYLIDTVRPTSDAAEYPLDQSDAKMVSRHLTFGLTDQRKNDNAVLQGNWSGDFSGGTEPTYWTASTQIFEQYWKQNNTVVKYGQCWVFGAVLTSTLRSIGIGARQLTTFESAHESPQKDGTYTHIITNYFDDVSHKVVQRSGSVWNFHSWVEAYLDRPDLDAGASGWQAVDATPQESSEGLMRMGPASIKLIHDDVHTNYDVPFVVSEVASKIHSAIVHCTGSGNSRSCKIVKDLGEDADQNVAGLIATKAEGKTSNINDITSTYHDVSPSPSAPLLLGSDHLTPMEAVVQQWKRRLDSRVERVLSKFSHRGMLRGAKTSIRDTAPRFQVMISARPTLMGMPMPISVMLFGDPAQTVDQVIDFTVHADFINYDGTEVSHMQNATATATVGAANGYRDVWDVDFQNYLVDLPLITNVRLSVVAIAKGSDATQTDVTSTSFILPPLMASAQIQSDNSYKITFTMTNPLSVPLTGVKMQAYCAAIGLDATWTPKDVPAGGTFLETVSSAPNTAVTGYTEVLGAVDFKEIVDDIKAVVGINA